MSHTSDWHEKAAQQSFRTGHFIAGRLRPSAGDGAFVTENPASRSANAEFADATTAEVGDAVDAARAAVDGSWRRTSPAERKRLLLHLADLMLESADRLALFDSLEMGKPIAHALADVDTAADFIRFNAELADKSAGDIAATDRATTLAMTFAEPWGVVGAIVPWNYPLVTAACAIGPALAAGNSMVLKPSEYSPSSALCLAELAASAGLPDGVLNVIVGRGHTTGEALARHPDVDKLHFTGSPGVGRQLMIYAGESNGKPVMLETGGKSPQIVFSDAADIDDLGRSLAQAAFTNSGQLCVARTRLLVQRGAEDRVRAALTRGIGSFRAGDPLSEETSFGPIASRKQYERVHGYVDWADEAGVSQWPVDDAGMAEGPGYFVAPRVYCDVDPSARIAQEEIFGPVLAVTSFDSEEDAIALANGVDYGLAATVWTRDLGRARRLSHRLNAGRIDIRTTAIGGASLAELAAEPFGTSGFGPLGGTAGFKAYTRQKGVQFITA